MKVSIKFEGEKAVKENLRRLALQYPEETGKALHAEGLAIQAEAQKLCPVDTGRLHATAYTSPPEDGSHGPEVQVGFGTAYALYVHERTEITRPTGQGQAKFLETPARAAQRGFAARVAERIRRLVGRGGG